MSTIRGEVQLTAQSLTASEQTARIHFQQCIDYLEKSFEFAGQSNDPQRIDRILSKIFLTIFTMTGSCKKRGFCCRNFTLHANGKYLTSPDDFEKACKHHPDWEIFIYKESNGEQAFFTCSKLDAQTGLCTIYDQRPQVCRDFPYSSLSRGMAPDTGCGFKYRLRFFLPKLTNRVLLDRVAGLLMQMQQWEEAAYMYEQSGHRSQAAVLKAQRLAEQNRYHDAIRELEAVEKEEPGNSDVPEALALCHLKLAERFLGTSEENHNQAV